MKVVMNGQTRNGKNNSRKAQNAKKDIREQLSSSRKVPEESVKKPEPAPVVDSYEVEQTSVVEGEMPITCGAEQVAEESTAAQTVEENTANEETTAEQVADQMTDEQLDAVYQKQKEKKAETKLDESLLDDEPKKGKSKKNGNKTKKSTNSEKTKKQKNVAQESSPISASFCLLFILANCIFGAIGYFASSLLISAGVI